MCVATGDPHYTTFDGKYFDFYGLGCYYLLKTPQITIQTKLEQVDKWQHAASYHTKVQVAVGTSKVVITAKGGKVSLSPSSPAGMTASTATSGKLTLSISSVGVKMYINPWKYGADVDRGMDVYVEVKSGFKCGSVMGLCGNFNCKSSDDKPEAKRSSPKNAVPMGGDSICTSPAPPPRPAGDLCTSDAKLKATATALCSKFKGDTQKQCIGDICLTGKTPFVNARLTRRRRSSRSRRKWRRTEAHRHRLHHLLGSRSILASQSRHLSPKPSISRMFKAEDACTQRVRLL
jgi:hypothetical protein